MSALHSLHSIDSSINNLSLSGMTSTVDHVTGWTDNNRKCLVV